MNEEEKAKHEEKLDREYEEGREKRDAEAK